LQPPLVPGGEPVVQLLERDAPLGGLPFRVFVTVDDHPTVVGEVGAELDHERAEVVVDAIDVEVVGHPVLLGDPREHRARIRVAPLAGTPHPGLLLGDSDEQDPLIAVELGKVLQRHVVLALARLEADPVDACFVGEAVHRGDKRFRDRLHQRPRRERLATVVLEEADHPKFPLQLRYVQVQVHPIDGLNLQGDVRGQHISSGTR